MNGWLARQVGAVCAQAEQPIILLDPKCVLTEANVQTLAGEQQVLVATDWRSLRLCWDLQVRRNPARRAIVLLSGCSEFQQPHSLPWEIETTSTVLLIRWPIPAQLVPLYKDLPEEADTLVTAWEATQSVSACLTATFGIHFGTAVDELEGLVRISNQSNIPATLWELLAVHCSTPLAQEIAWSAGSLVPLQRAWNDWLQQGATSLHDSTFRQAPGPILQLLSEGRLEAAHGSAVGLPAWSRLGVSSHDSASAIHDLLKQPPKPGLDFETWSQMASWWGHIRYLCAIGRPPTELLDQADATWASLNADFLKWLTVSYGLQLSSAAPMPRGLHQIGRFLAWQVKAGSKVLLVVLDGMSFAQWHQIRTEAGLHVERAHACLAMLPTLTEISRQAIFAGCLPKDFAESLGTTKHEEKRWRAFWTTLGLKESEVAYRLVKGDQHIELPATEVKVTAVVVSAIDLLLHDSNLLGDAQLAINVRLWLKTKVLTDFVRQGTAAGYEIWLTSDHGNVECLGKAIPSQGALTDRRGERVLFFPNAVLRKPVEQFGIPWRPPGYPELESFLLFAKGRDGFYQGGTKVTHGGISIDEVLVPFVQVKA